MSQKPWKRVYGLPHRRWDATDGLNSDGQPKLADCNVFGTSNVVRSAGFTNQTRGRRELAACGSFHHHVMTFDDGSQEWAPHTTSTQCIGGAIHQENRKRRLANLTRGALDTAPGSTGLVSQPITETRVLLDDELQPALWRVSGAK
jgi:hypothetical protein